MKIGKRVKEQSRRKKVWSEKRKKRKKIHKNE